MERPMTDVVAPAAVQSIHDRAHQASDLAQAILEEVKPRLRGMLHAAIAPMALAAGVVLVMSAAPGAPRLGSAVFAVSALVLFSVSAALHRGRWTPNANR